MWYEKEEQLLKEFGCEGIEYSSLVNNYFYKFTYKGKKFTIEHMLNVYGAEVDFWELCKEEDNKIYKTFNTLKELLDYIK
jgi:hypothetical protein